VDGMEGNSSSQPRIIVQNYYCMPPGGLPPEAAAAAQQVVEYADDRRGPGAGAATPWAGTAPRAAAQQQQQPLWRESAAAAATVAQQQQPICLPSSQGPETQPFTGKWQHFRLPPTSTPSQATASAQQEQRQQEQRQLEQRQLGQQEQHQHQNQHQHQHQNQHPQQQEQHPHQNQQQQHPHAAAPSHRTSDAQSFCRGGQHFHRIAGDCGHRPILHNPPGGVAHIDFVVDGKVECYEGTGALQMRAAPPESGGPGGAEGEGQDMPVWPSRYLCDQIGCTDNNPDREGPCKQPGHVQHQKPPGDPKEFDLGDIDLESDEWNENFFEEGAGALSGSPHAEHLPLALPPGWNDRYRAREESGGNKDHLR